VGKNREKIHHEDTKDTKKSKRKQARSWRKMFRRVVGLYAAVITPADRNFKVLVAFLRVLRVFVVNILILTC